MAEYTFAETQEHTPIPPASAGEAFAEPAAGDAGPETFDDRPATNSEDSGGDRPQEQERWLGSSAATASVSPPEGEPDGHDEDAGNGYGSEHYYRAERSEGPPADSGGGGDDGGDKPPAGPPGGGAGFEDDGEGEDHASTPGQIPAPRESEEYFPKAPHQRPDSDAFPQGTGGEPQEIPEQAPPGEPLDLQPGDSYILREGEEEWRPATPEPTADDPQGPPVTLVLSCDLGVVRADPAETDPEANPILTGTLTGDKIVVYSNPETLVAGLAHVMQDEAADKSNRKLIAAAPSLADSGTAVHVLGGAHPITPGQPITNWDEAVAELRDMRAGGGYRDIKGDPLDPEKDYDVLVYPGTGRVLAFPIDEEGRRLGDPAYDSHRQ